MKRLRNLGIVLGAVGLFILGYWSAPQSSIDQTHSVEEHDHGSGEMESQVPTQWTCPMHPEIKLPEFGACPKCGMDLVPMAAGDDDLGPRRLAMSPSAIKLAGIETAQIVRRFVTMSVRMAGKVDYDETRVRTIAARVPGRLDRLYVDYTGISVKKGDHLVWLYSPELLEAQQELIEAKNRLDVTKDESSQFLSESNRRGYDSARGKLLLWGLTEDQVDEIISRGTAEDHMMILSPEAGVVGHKALNEGDYVKEGTPIYRIADLSHLWVLLDAYEQDLPWLRYGQKVQVQTEAIPGEVLDGWISFIDPVVSEKTRTVKVRVNIENSNGRLKPGMFVRGTVQSRIGDGGRVLEPSLMGKWISPMHPEIIRDQPGTCDVCGMDLVPAESLGFLSVDSVEKPLIAPASSVLITGKRAVVYVEVPNMKKPTFEGREVTLGPRAGDYYIVRDGLAENERVVINGAFRIDSSMQIQAKPSMMSLQGDKRTFLGPETVVFRNSLDSLFAAYFDLQQALASDDVDAARQSANKLSQSIAGIESSMLPKEAESLWDEESRLLKKESQDLQDGDSIDEARQHFEGISTSLMVLENTFSHQGDSMRYEVFCPMAFDNKGASWIQRTDDIRNPYFGASMLQCGEVKREFSGVLESMNANVNDSDPRGESESNHKHDPDEEAAEENRPNASEEDSSPGLSELDNVYEAYFILQEALADDRFEDAKSSVLILSQRIQSVQDARESDSSSPSWSGVVEAISLASSPTSIDSLRGNFEGISKGLIELHALFPHSGESPFFHMNCSMALDSKGADWLQRDETLANPYFGKSMLRCGTIEGELPGIERGR